MRGCSTRYSISDWGESGPSSEGWLGTRLHYEASKQLLILQRPSAPPCILRTTENTAVADMPRHLSYLGLACLFIPLNIGLRGTPTALIPGALSIACKRTTASWPSLGHSGLGGKQETTLTAKGVSSAVTVHCCCCWQSAQPPYDATILFRQEDQGSLTLV